MIYKPSLSKARLETDSAVSDRINTGWNGCQITNFFQCLVNNVWMLEMIVGKEIELIEKISNVYAAQGVHLRKWKDAWKSVLLAHNRC